MGLFAFEAIFGLPGGGLGGLWGPLGRRWTLLARLLALLGVFWGVSGGRSGRNLDQPTFLGLIFGLV